MVPDVIIRFIVRWRANDALREEGEHAVLLVDMTLSRKTHA